MKLSLAQFKHRYDYGHNWYIQILVTENWSLFQGSVGWNDYPSWPYLQIKSGYGSTLSVLFCVYKFEIDIGFIERTWNWDYMNQNDIFDND